MSQTSEIFSSKMTADVSGDAIIAIGFFIGFFVLDTLFKIFGWFKNDKTGRYLSLHIICNAIVVALSFEDTITTYRQPAIVSYMAEFTDKQNLSKKYMENGYGSITKRIPLSSQRRCKH